MVSNTYIFLKIVSCQFSWEKGKKWRSYTQFFLLTYLLIYSFWKPHIFLGTIILCPTFNKILNPNGQYSSISQLMEQTIHTRHKDDESMKISMIGYLDLTLKKLKIQYLQWMIYKVIISFYLSKKKLYYYLNEGVPAIAIVVPLWGDSKCTPGGLRHSLTWAPPKALMVSGNKRQ